MSEEKRALHDTIDVMPEEWVKKILEYIELLKSSNADLDIPERLIVRSEEELSQKLTEAIEDKESIPLSEVVNRMNKVINE